MTDIEKAITPGGRVGDASHFSTSTTSNWVARTGGLPTYILEVAHALIRSGHPEGEAIGLAVGTMKRWASGGGSVTPKVRAAAAAALAEFEAKAKASKIGSAVKDAAKDGSKDESVKKELELVEKGAWLETIVNANGLGILNDLPDPALDESFTKLGVLEKRRMERAAAKKAIKPDADLDSDVEDKKDKSDVIDPANRLIRMRLRAAKTAPIGLNLTGAAGGVTMATGAASTDVSKSSDGRHVRTPSGAKYFGVPIGTPITAALKIAAQAKHGGKDLEAFKAAGEKDVPTAKLAPGPARVHGFGMAIHAAKTPEDLDAVQAALKKDAIANKLKPADYKALKAAVEEQHAHLGPQGTMTGGNKGTVESGRLSAGHSVVADAKMPSVHQNSGKSSDMKGDHAVAAAKADRIAAGRAAREKARSDKEVRVQNQINADHKVGANVPAAPHEIISAHLANINGATNDAAVDKVLHDARADLIAKKITAVDYSKLSAAGKKRQDELKLVRHAGAKGKPDWFDQLPANRQALWVPGDKPMEFDATGPGGKIRVVLKDGTVLDGTYQDSMGRWGGADGHKIGIQIPGRKSNKWIARSDVKEVWGDKGIGLGDMLGAVIQGHGDPESVRRHMASADARQRAEAAAPASGGITALVNGHINDIKNAPNVFEREQAKKRAEDDLQAAKIPFRRFGAIQAAYDEKKAAGFGAVDGPSPLGRNMKPVLPADKPASRLVVPKARGAEQRQALDALRAEQGPELRQKAEKEYESIMQRVDAAKNVDELVAVRDHFRGSGGQNIIRGKKGVDARVILANDLKRKINRALYRKEAELNARNAAPSAEERGWKLPEVSDPARKQVLDDWQGKIDNADGPGSVEDLQKKLIDIPEADIHNDDFNAVAGALEARDEFYEREKLKKEALHGVDFDPAVFDVKPEDLQDQAVGKKLGIKGFGVRYSYDDSHWDGHESDSPAGQALKAGAKIEDLKDNEGLLAYAKANPDRFTVIRAEGGREGVSGNWTVVDKDNGNKKYFFKNSNTDGGGRMYGDGVNEYLAAGLIRKVFGDKMAPGVVFADPTDGEHGNPRVRADHLEEFAKAGGGTNVAYNNARGEIGPSNIKDPRQALAISLFDYLINNTDRHAGNFGSYEEDGKRNLIPLDMGGGFAAHAVNDHSPASWFGDRHSHQKGVDNLTVGAYQHHGWGRDKMAEDIKKIVGEFNEGSMDDVAKKMMQENPDMNLFDQAHGFNALESFRDRLKQLQETDPAQIVKHLGL